MLALERLKKELPESLDAAIVCSPINRRYFTGFSSTAGILLVTREEAYFLIDFRYYEKAAATINGATVILLEDATRQLGDLLKKHNCHTVGVEANRMTLFEYETYCEQFPFVTFSKENILSDWIDSSRMVKTQEEIDKILEAQKIAEDALQHILGYISEGLTEIQVKRELERFILDRADGLAFDTIIASGRNSALPHAVPSDKRLEEGDFLTMDFGAVIDGYHSDMTRTVFIGHPSEEQIRLYKTVLFGQHLALDFVKAGKKCCEVDRLVREYFDSQGYAGAFGHNLGHSLGLEIHESPRLSPKSDIVLQEGMIVTIEPGLYLPGKFGVRIEDMVKITENGCENLTGADKELICL